MRISLLQATEEQNPFAAKLKQHLFYSSSRLVVNKLEYFFPHILNVFFTVGY